MTWYMHWLELRWRLVLVVAAGVLMGLVTVDDILSKMEDYRRTGEVGRQIEPYISLLAPLGPMGLFTWYSISSHVGNVLMFAPLLLVFGTLQQTSPPSAYLSNSASSTPRAFFPYLVKTLRLRTCSALSGGISTRSSGGTGDSSAFGS